LRWNLDVLIPRKFTTAVVINYQANVLVAKSPDADFDKNMPVVQLSDQVTPSPARSTISAAVNCRPGTRFPSCQVISQADARPWQLHQKMLSGGRFRTVVFAGDIANSAQRQRVNRLRARLGSALLPKYRTMTLSAVGQIPTTTARGL
jgi:hypothetical protein